jgi:hypothetical protein
MNEAALAVTLRYPEIQDENPWIDIPQSVARR